MENEYVEMTDEEICEYYYSHYDCTIKDLAVMLGRDKDEINQIIINESIFK